MLSRVILVLMLMAVSVAASAQDRYRRPLAAVEHYEIGPIVARKKPILDLMNSYVVWCLPGPLLNCQKIKLRQGSVSRLWLLQIIRH